MRIREKKFRTNQIWFTFLIIDYVSACTVQKDSKYDYVQESQEKSTCGGAMKDLTMGWNILSMTIFRNMETLSLYSSCSSKANRANLHDYCIILNCSLTHHIKRYIKQHILRSYRKITLKAYACTIYAHLTQELCTYNIGLRMKNLMSLLINI